MDQDDSPLEKVIDELSREADQDKAARDDAGSYLVSADASDLVHREREYRDVEKHWVRGRWLKVAQDIVSRNGRQLKYLTLPAYYRLDVSLFMKHDLIDTTMEDGKLVCEVAAFETDPTK